MSDFIPDSQFVPDQAAPQMQASKAAPDFIPEGSFTSDEDKYGSLGQQAIAGVEGAARGASLGLSDLAETGLGIASPEDIKGRMEQNPITSGGGQILGTVGLAGATGGAGLAAEALGGGVAATAGAAALEGGVIGAGNAVSDYALNDNLTAQNVISDVGVGALLGGGLGLAGNGLEKLFPAATQGVSKALRSTLGISEAAVPEATAISDVASSARTGVQPTTYKDIADRVAAAKADGSSIELPQKDALQDALSRVQLENPVHPLQMESLNDQAARDAYGTYKEMPGKEGDALRGYEALQKKELVNKSDDAIRSLAPGSQLTSDASKGGNIASDAFAEQYQEEKKALGPIFESLKKTPLAEADVLPSIVGKMTDAVPGIAKMFDTEGADLAIKPYKTAMGIDKSTYTAVKEAVESLRTNPSDFEALQNIRNGLDQNIDVTAQGQGAGQIRALKAAMMDYMQDAVQKVTPDVEVREAFKRYAINEQERKVIEKTFGASVGNNELGILSKVKPEQVGDKIFSNTASVGAAKNILPPEKFNQILGNWLMEAREAATDKGVFSSNKFGSFLRRNQDALKVAFSDNPGALQQLKDINTISRILPDAASVNPSGTAKTLIHQLKGASSLGELAVNTASFLKDKTIGKVQNEIAMANLNNRLAGKAQVATLTERLNKINEKVTDQITKLSKSIFTDNRTRGAIVSAATRMSPEEFEDRTKKITQLASNPQMTMDHVSSITQPIVKEAPGVAQGLSSSLVNGINFLNSKIPRPSLNLPLSEKWQPSKSQMDNFNKYYESVNSPLKALDQIKNGTLSSQMMEGLKTVHPDLLAEMQKNVMGNIADEGAKNINYGTKIALAKFLGHPLDNSMMPQSIAANQAAINGPDLSQHGSAQAAQGGRTRKPSMGGLKQLDLASRAQTQTQKPDESV